MLSNLLNVFKIPDLRNKVLFTLAMIGLYRVGANIQVPGIDRFAVAQIRDNTGGGVLGIFSLFTGGAFESFSIFALGIMPYITASIIMQLLGVVIPKLEELQEQGAVGQRKITQYTRYVAMVLALMQATIMVYIFGPNGQNTRAFVQAPAANILPEGLWPAAFFIVPALVCGTAVLMWMGELISQRGIGQGISMIIFASVVSSLMPGLYQIFLVNGTFWLILMLITLVIVVVAVVFIELGQRRIPVKFATRVVGRRQIGGQNTYIPLKVNQSGVIPIIFASSILILPAMFVTFFGNPDPNGNWWARFRAGIQDFVNRYVLEPTNAVYVTIFFLLIIAFAYFYNSIAFDPYRQADQLRKQGGFIPGVRPGPQTEHYLAKAVNRITLPGAVFIAGIAVLPYIIQWIGNIDTFAFAGASILISVGVSLELMRQIDSQMTLRNYEGFLK